MSFVGNVKSKALIIHSVSVSNTEDCKVFWGFSLVHWTWFDSLSDGVHIHCINGCILKINEYGFRNQKLNLISISLLFYSWINWAQERVKMNGQCQSGRNCWALILPPIPRGLKIVPLPVLRYTTSTNDVKEHKIQSRNSTFSLMFHRHWCASMVNKNLCHEN